MHNALVAASALLLAHCGASPIAALKARQSCPDVHVFGARETTAPEGFGTAGVVVDLVLGAYSGATSEAIDYPACGGQSSCGGDDYSTSMTKGIQAVASAVNSFHEQCPDTQLVLVGYSQGGQIIDNAFCGGPDDSNGYTDSSPAIDSSALSAIAAVIEMGSPRFVSSLDYGVGTCSAGGFSARPSGYTCSSSAKMQSYCDAADPYCCDGNDESTHQGYGDVYGQDALTFIQGQLDGASSGSTSSDSTQQEGGANGTSSSTEDSSSSGGTASVPTAGDGQSSSGSQDSGAQAGNQGANQWNQNNGAQGGNQWGQAGQGQGQWGGWGKKN